MLKEFKEFALKGNVLDLAIGIVIGSAFGKIVTSVVNDLAYRFGSISHCPDGEPMAAAAITGDSRMSFLPYEHPTCCPSMSALHERI